MIVHTFKGEENIKNSLLERHEIDWPDFLPSNPRMACGKDHVSNTRRHLARNFNRMSYERLQEVYANKGDIRKPWTLVEKGFRFISKKITVKKRSAFIEHLLNHYKQKKR